MNGFLESAVGGAIWGVGFAAALGAMRVAGGGVRPLVKGVVNGTLAVTDWVRSATQESRETLQDLYNEAKADRKARE